MGRTGISRHPEGRAWPQLRVKRLSSSPLSSDDDNEILVDCPPFLDGDPTAYATYIPDNSLGITMRAGMLIYVTQRRDPREGDVAILTQKSGRTYLRYVFGVLDDAYSVKWVGANGEIHEGRVPFEELEEVAIMAGSCRL